MSTSILNAACRRSTSLWSLPVGSLGHRRDDALDRRLAMRSAHRGRRNRVVVAESGGGGVRPRGHEGARLRGPEAAPSGAGKRGLWSDERPRRGRPRERRESARAGLLPSRRRRRRGFAAVPGHQRLDRPTLGRGDLGRVGDGFVARGRKGDASSGRRTAPPPPPPPPRSSSWAIARDIVPRSFDSVSRRAGLLKYVRSPSFPRIPRAHAEPSDHHHRAEREEQPGGERRSHEKPHRRHVRRGGDHHHRRSRRIGGGGDGSSIGGGADVCDAPAVIRGGAAGAGGATTIGSVLATARSYDSNTTSLSCRSAPAPVTSIHATRFQGDSAWSNPRRRRSQPRRRRSPHRPGRPPGSTPTATCPSRRRRRRRSR